MGPGTGAGLGEVTPRPTRMGVLRLLLTGPGTTNTWRSPLGRRMPVSQCLPGSAECQGAGVLTHSSWGRWGSRVVRGFAPHRASLDRPLPSASRPWQDSGHGKHTGLCCGARPGQREGAGLVLRALPCVGAGVRRKPVPGALTHLDPGTPPSPEPIPVRERVAGSLSRPPDSGSAAGRSGTCSGRSTRRTECHSHRARGPRKSWKG